jgi:hypothetical protein
MRVGSYEQLLDYPADIRSLTISHGLIKSARTPPTKTARQGEAEPREAEPPDLERRQVIRAARECPRLIVHLQPTDLFAVVDSLIPAKVITKPNLVMVMKIHDCFRRCD